MEIYSKMSLPSILKAYSFEKFDVIVDVAGGMGQLITGILGAAPKSKGILFDLPKTIQSAKAFSIFRDERTLSVYGRVCLRKFLPAETCM